MPRVVYSATAVASFARLFERLMRDEPEIATRAAGRVRSAVELLGEHPYVGRAVRGDIRELVISFGRTGYVALYRFVPGCDQVRVLAIRHQRELGYPR